MGTRIITLDRVRVADLYDTLRDYRMLLDSAISMNEFLQNEDVVVTLHRRQRFLDELSEYLESRLD